MSITRIICAAFALLAFNIQSFAEDETFVVQRVGTRLTMRHPFVVHNREEGLAGFSNALYYTITRGNAVDNYDVGLTLRDSLPDGIYKVYLDSSFNYLLLQAQYKSGNRTGEWVYYYPNQKPAYKLNYLNNKRNGAATTYDYKGAVLCRKSYLNDSLNGILTYTSRELQIKATYVNNLPQGWAEVLSNWFGTPVKQTGFFKQGVLIDSLGSVPNGGIAFNSNTLQEAYAPAYTDTTLLLRYESDTQFEGQLQQLKRRTDIAQLHITLGSMRTARKVDSLLTLYLPALKAQTKLNMVWIEGGRKNSFPSALYQLSTISTIWFYAGARHYYPGEPEEDDTTNLPFDNRIAQLTKLKTLDIERDFTPKQMQQMVQMLATCKNLRSIHFGDYYDFNKLPGNLNLLTGLKEITGLHIGDADSAGLYKLFKLAGLEHLDVEPYGNEERWYDSLFVHLPLCQVTVFRTCFPAGTPVRMADGNEKPIEQLQPGEAVLAFDTATLQLDTAVITKLFNSGSEQKPLLEITYGKQQQLHCTFNHPVFVFGKGYIAAEQLRAGDWIIGLYDGCSYEQIQSVETLPLRSKVYNIETTVHNYFASNVLVHNK